MEDLWRIRQRKQMTIAQLSAKAGIPARLIQEYEAGIRSVPMSNLEKLARALFVDVMDIKSLSDPAPPEPADVSIREPRERPMPTAPAPREARAPRAAPPRERVKAPARESQVVHLLRLAERFDYDQAALEGEIGKPLTELTRIEASQWLKRLQERVVAERPRRAKKRRPYLPESVDSFELEYLQRQMENESLLVFRLFNGEEVAGTVIGHGPYSITIRSQGEEMTLNKLAIAYYWQKQAAEGQSR